MVNNIVGSTVQDEDFFDRKRELARLSERLEVDNVLLLAPRRVGKTSLMYRLRDDARRRGDLAIYLSVSDVTTEFALIQKLYEAAQTLAPAKKAIIGIGKGPLGRFVKRIKRLGFMSASIELIDDAQDQWAELGNALARVLNQLEKRCLLLIDELPVFVLALLRQDPTAGRARTFLNWFRQLRIDPLTSKRIRWLIAGSIGLDTVTQRMHLSDTINDLYLFNDLGAFSDDVADAFLDELGKSYHIPLSRPVKRHIRSRIGWLIPYHLQIFFAALRDHCGDRDSKPGLAAVDRAYETLLSPGKKAYFDYWSQRLAEELGPPDDLQALDLLNAVARNPDGEAQEILRSILRRHIPKDDERRDQHLRYLLDALTSDGYLVLDSGRYQFRSFLLRDFWLRRMIG